MYESFFSMTHAPFSSDILTDQLYEFQAVRKALGRLTYVANRQLFAELTANSGCGKSALLRKFNAELPQSDYLVLYLSDSKLTPRWFYKGLLDQLGLGSASTYHRINY